VVTPAEKADVAAAVARVKAGACSRCGECDGSCSQNLHISWLLRAAYVENHRLMPFETQPHLRYFDLHPERFTALCADCTQVTCRCPYGIDIPRDIGRVHGLMVDLLRRGRAVASPKVPEPRAPYAAALAGWDRDEVERPGWIPACRLSLQNTGSASWVMPPPYPFVSLEVTEHGVPRHELALRSDIGPDMPCMFAFPLAIGAPTDGFRLALLVRDRDSHEITHRIELGGIPESAGSPYALSYRGHTIQATLGRGAACEAEVEIRNDSVVPWCCDDPVPDTLHLAVWTDGEYAGGGRLPAVVEPGQSVRVPVTFTMPDRLGAVLVKLDMVHQNVAFFESRGVAPLRLRVVAGGAVSGRIGAPDPTGPTGLAPEWPEYDAAYLAHRLPASVPPGARLGVWVRLENTGSFTWDVNTIGGARQISVAAHINDRFAGGVALLQPVPPGGRADVHLAMEAPARAGNYEVEIGLVHEGVAFFKARGVAPLMAPLKVVGKSVAEGSRAFEVMRERNSWFYQPSSGITVAADGGSYPAMVTRARGCHLWDGTGRRVIDYTMGWGCALLGHAYEPVQKAVRAALDDGATVPMPYPLEAEVTEMLCADIPCAESVVFGKNGSDVCTVAVRLARTITGRTTVLHCGWHGWQDWCIESLGIAATGVPAPPHPRTHRFRFNDLADFQRLLGLYGHDLAAVMLEPSGPAGEQPYGVGGDVQPDFLRHVAEQARAAGALVIFDEIITGFRVPGGSVQAATGVIPDLACFGKALANGLPLAALVGRREVFGAMPRAFYGPTFKGELYALAAARAALLAYRDKPVAKTVDRAGRRLKGTLERLIRDMDIPAVVHGPNFRFGVFFQDPDPHRQLVLKTLYMQELLKGGVVPYNTLMLPSFAHDDAALRETEAVCTRALERIRRALDAGDLHAVLEIPLVVR
jgi:glutamate-1-semialdehyde aminotransferase/ferredoxin